MGAKRNLRVLADSSNGGYRFGQAITLAFLVGGGAVLGCSSESVDPNVEPAEDVGPASTDAGFVDAAVDGGVEGLTYYQDIKPIIDARCSACHRPDGIGPFQLTTADDVTQLASVINNQVQNRLMPPWPPDNQCRTYKHDRSLTDAQIAMINEWVEGGAQVGDANNPGAPLPGGGDGLTRIDRRLEIPEYTPEGRDDYHCFVIEWPDAETAFVSGFGLEPGNPSVVHHVNMYIATAAAATPFRDRQNAAPGPGFPCFGGIFANGISLMGAWAPGSIGLEFPAGTGIQIEPGSALVLEMHFNTGVGREGADQSTVLLRTESSVERRAAILPLTNIAWTAGQMQIPAGQPEVKHEITYSGLFANIAIDQLAPWLSGEVLEIHAAGLHMHYLGSRGRMELRRGGENECVIEIPDWDFDWQAGYLFEQTTTFDPNNDALRLECQWDNTDANQPVIDGVQRPAVDVNWGTNSDDEMCIGYLYVTATN